MQPFDSIVIYLYGDRHGGTLHTRQSTPLGSYQSLLPSILKIHFQEKSVLPADSSPVILVMLEMR